MSGSNATVPPQPVTNPPVVCVPLTVDAFVLNELLFDKARKSKICPLNLPDYTALGFGSQLRADIQPNVDVHDASPASINTRIADVGGTGAIRKDRVGIYLHWVIPKAFRSSIAATESAAQGDQYKKQRLESGMANEGEGKDDAAEPEFRPVPDRWLVLRQIINAKNTDGGDATEDQAPLLQAFIVESNRVRDVSEFLVGEDVETEAAPYINRNRAPHQQGNTYIGKKYLLDNWVDGDREENVGLYQSPLTVNIVPSEMFADYQLHNANVFSIHDDLSYRATDGTLQTLQSAQVSYMVAGYYARKKQDPFYLDETLKTDAHADAPTHKKILEACFMTLKNQDPETNPWLKTPVTNSRLICHGARYNVMWSNIKVPDHVPAEKFAETFAEEHPVALGADLMDAVEAYVAVQTRAGRQADAKTKTLSTVSRLLRQTQSSESAKREAANKLFRERFKPTTGGVVYMFGSENDANPGGISTTNPGQQKEPTEDELKVLHEINVRQTYLDACLRHRDTLCFRLWCEWWKLRAEQEFLFTQEMIAGEADAYGKRMRQIRARVQDYMAELDILGVGDDPRGRIKMIEKDIENLKKRPELRAAAANLKQGLQATFYSRKDPSIVIVGMESPWTSDLGQSNLTVRLNNEIPVAQPTASGFQKLQLEMLKKWTENKANLTGIPDFKALSEGFIVRNTTALNVFNQLPLAQRKWLQAYQEALQDYKGKVPEKLQSTFSDLLLEWTLFSQASYADGGVPDQPAYPIPIRGDNAPRTSVMWDNTQSFCPLYIEWEAEYYHIPFEYWSLRSESDGTVVYSINEGLELSSAKAIRSDRRVVSGRSNLLPEVATLLKIEIKKLLENSTMSFFGLKSGESGNDKKLEEMKDNLYAGIKGLPFLAANLSGLTDHLLTLVGGTHITPYKQEFIPGLQDQDIFDERMINILRKSACDVSPYGRYLDFQATRTDSRERVFPFKPVTHGQLRMTKLNIVDKFGQVICGLPKPKGGDFVPLLPYTSAALSCQANSPLGPYFANTVVQDPEGQCQFIQLSPAINQDVRLNACFVVCDNDIMSKKRARGSDDPWLQSIATEKKIPWRPCSEWENPVWGWLMVNYRDGGLQIYEGDGNFRAEALLREGRVFWRPEGAARFSGDDDDDYSEYAADVEVINGKIATLQLDRFIRALKKPAYLAAMMDVVKEALEVLPSVPSAFGESTASVLGRPLALVNTAWSLELACADMFDQSDTEGRPATSEAHPTALKNYAFTLKLGDKKNSGDGVVGYFREESISGTPGEGTKQLDFSCLCTEFGDPLGPPIALPSLNDLFCVSSLPRLRAYHFNPVNLSPESFKSYHDGMFQTFGMIIDPFSNITGYTGILPPKQLKLPPWTVQRALSKMKPVISVGPVLIPGDLPNLTSLKVAEFGPNGVSYYDDEPESALPDPNAPKIPAHAPSEGDWVWLQPRAVTEDAEEVEYVEISLGEYQTGFVPTAGPHTAIEGFMQLRRLPEIKT